MSVLYFAYGSNLHPGRLAARAPSAALVGTAWLADHGLRFHKRSRDGSAKCDVVPAPGETVHGALYRLAPGDWAALDAAEEGYDRHAVAVRSGRDVVSAVTYRAAATHVVAALLPYAWYRALVAAGARHHGFPASYVASIEDVPAREDRDRTRAARMDGLVADLRAS